jgi:carbamoyl-phosphate synthase large subunit
LRCDSIVTLRGGHRAANVLVTAAGRRTTLVHAFVEAAHARGGHVVTSDVDPLAPTLAMADAAVPAPHTGDPGYIEALLDIVDDHAIGLVVPTIDPDLQALAPEHAAFRERGCRLIVSSAGFVSLVLDKFETTRVFAAEGITVPRTWLPPTGPGSGLPERVFVKPRRGSASKDTYEVPVESLTHVLALVEDPVVQEVLVGPEISIDALLSLDGTPLHYVPRSRIRAVGGESVQGMTLHVEPGLSSWIEQVLTVCQRLGAVGPLTIQAFLTDDGPVLTEINARFGGGFPLALQAGAQYPAWILDMMSGATIEPSFGAYEAGLYMTRYNVERFVRQPAW